MEQTSDYCIEEVDSEEDTTKFLELLLRYDYVWRSDCDEALKLNLTRTEIPQFLSECREFLHYLDEDEAAKKIENIRHLYNEVLQNNEDKSKFSWFSLADKLFRRTLPSASTETPVSRHGRIRKAMEGSEGSMSASQSSIQDDISPSAHGANLTRKEKKESRKKSISLRLDETKSDNFHLTCRQNLSASFKYGIIHLAISQYMAKPMALVPINQKSNIKSTTKNITSFYHKGDDISKEILRDFYGMEIGNSSSSEASSIESSVRSRLSPSPEIRIVPFPGSSPSTGINVAPSSRNGVDPSPRSGVDPSPRSGVDPSPRSGVDPSPRSSMVPSPRSSMAPSPISRAALPSFTRTFTGPLASRFIPGWENRFVSPSERRAVSPSERRSIFCSERNPASLSERCSVYPSEK